MACRNPNCVGTNPVKSGWCTASKCKEMRKLMRAASTEAKQQQAAALAGVAAAVTAPYVNDGLQCWKVYSVHGQMECGIACLGGAQAPPAKDEQIHFVIYGSFAATEDEYVDGGGRDQLRLVKLKELVKNCWEDIKTVSAYEKNRYEPHKAARKRLHDAVEAEEGPEELD